MKKIGQLALLSLFAILTLVIALSIVKILFPTPAPNPSEPIATEPLDVDKIDETAEDASNSGSVTILTLGETGVEGMVKALQDDAIGKDGSVTVSSIYSALAPKGATLNSGNSKDFEIAGNEGWKRAAEYAIKAEKAAKEGDYDAALQEIQQALDFDSPHREEYLAKESYYLRRSGKNPIEKGGGALDEEFVASRGKGVRRALLVAVQKYDSPYFSELSNIENDLELMKEELLRANFEERNISVLRVVGSGKLPNRDYIRAEIENLTKLCGSDDFIFVFFTGHGLRDPKTQKDYFVPSDAKGLDYDTMVPLDGVIDSLARSAAKFKWLIVDACRNTGKGVDDATPLGKLEPKSGMLIFQSSASGEESHFTDDQKYSLFINYFVEGLRGGAVKEDGRATVIGAFDYARNKIGDKQHPVYSSFEFFDFALYENQDWTQAAKHYDAASKCFDNKDYTQAKEEIDYAVKFVKDLNVDAPLWKACNRLAQSIDIVQSAKEEDEEDAASEENNSSIEPTSPIGIDASSI